MKILIYTGSSLAILLTILATLLPFTTQILVLPINKQADICYTRGIDLLARDSLQAAETKLKTALAYQPRYAPLHFGLAQVYERQGKLDDALRELFYTIDLDPESYYTVFFAGQILAASGDTAQAIVVLQRCISLNPYYTEGYEYLGTLYLQTGDFSSAERMFMPAERLSAREE